MANYLEQCQRYDVIEGDDGHGNALWLKSRWKNRYLELIHRFKINDIRLTEFSGSEISDVSFLLEIPNLYRVSIVSDQLTDLSPVFQLANLRTLSLFCRKAKIAGDFLQLKLLESIALDWRHIYKKVFELRDLSEATVFRYPNRDLAAWIYNTDLRKLFLSSSKLEILSGIESFPNLERLKLFRCPKLSSLNELESAKALRRLQIVGCTNFSELFPVSSLSNLEVLEIENCGTIDSLEPLAKCNQLKRLQVAGETTILDGDLSFLLDLPELKEVLLRNRKHYSHTDEELTHQR